jgi:hypothetical protein
MKGLSAVALAAALIGASSQAGAQDGVRFSAVAGPLRIDRLAGTPIVPSVGVHWSPGRRGFAGGRLALVRNAGFYSLNALSMDLDFGVRSRPGRVEWQTTAGPWFLLGGDGDGTPYALIAGQATGGVTWWARRHFGFLALASARLKLGESTERATASGALGVVVR